MASTYGFNTLGQMTWLNTPDAGQTNFYYDRVGRLRLSQNSKQAAVGNQYSYSNYDALGRLVEAGEKSSISGSAQAYVDANDTTVSGTFRIRTVYTTQATMTYVFDARTQRNLLNRISYVVSDEDGNYATTGDQVTTYYSYDPHGNVEWVIQPTLSVKTQQ